MHPPTLPGVCLKDSVSGTWTRTSLAGLCEEAAGEGQGGAGARIRLLSHQGPLGFQPFGKGVPDEVSKGQGQTEFISLLRQQACLEAGSEVWWWADRSVREPAVSLLSI